MRTHAILTLLTGLLLSCDEKPASPKDSAPDSLPGDSDSGDDDSTIEESGHSEDSDSGIMYPFLRPDTGSPVNMLQNPGFEDAIDEGWTNSLSMATIERVESASPEGAAHLQVVTEDEGYAWLYQTPNVEPGWPAQIRVDAAWQGMHGGGALVSGADLYESLSSFDPPLGDSGWATFDSPYYLPSADSTSFYLYFSGGERSWVDRVRLLQWDPSQIEGFESAGHRVGSAVYRMVGGARVRGEGTVLLPLPALHQGQVPLGFQVRTDPPEALVSISFEERWERDWMATVEVSTDSYATLQIEAWVLEAEIATPQRLADLAEEESDPSIWLEPTAIVQSDDPDIATAAITATLGLKSDQEKMMAILGFISDWMDGTEWPDALDAKSVFEAHMGSCTGYANLGAALGRAAGIPTRTVAGYPAWGSPLQTHYINEFYLEGQGWVRVEPQVARPVVAQHYMTVVSVVHPEQEGPEASSPDRWAAPGVPWYTLFELGEGSARLSFDPELFPTCAVCDHGAFGLFQVHLDELSRLDAQVELATERWWAFEDDMRAGKALAWLDGPFAALGELRDFEDLEAMLAR